jgi:hypothetical protein
MGDPRAKSYPGQASDADGASEPELQPDTVRPPFDPEEYARESESKIRIEAAQQTVPPPAQYAVGLASGTMAAFATVEPDVVALLLVARDDLEWFQLQPAARALLRHVDGQATIADIARLAGVPLEPAMKTLHELAREGIVTWRG